MNIDLRGAHLYIGDRLPPGGDVPVIISYDDDNSKSKRRIYLNIVDLIDVYNHVRSVLLNAGAIEP